MKKNSLLVAAAMFLAAAGTPGAAELPHLVIFVSDDLGRMETSIYGCEDVRTPTMEKLAAAGMTFDNAYVASPSCCPNRYSFLTGLMPARHGAHPNHSQPKAGTRFLPSLLQEMGYFVASFGKIAHGREGFEGCDFHSPNSRGLAEAVDAYFSENEVNQPVCLMVGDRRPHVPWTGDSIYDPGSITLPPYFVDTRETREHWARYLSDVTGMDEEMGRIHGLASRYLGDDFLFLFTSDHGGQWPMGKWNLYDSGTRVPLVVSWPGRVEAGVRSDAMVSWVDLLPTLIDLAGGEVPGGIDGRSFSPVLRGRSDSHRQAIFTTHTGDGAMNIYPIRSVRRGKFKYIHNLAPDAWFTNHSDRLRKDGAGAYWDSWDQAAARDEAAAEWVRRYHTRPEFELFDLEADPLELNNLAEDPKFQPEIAALRERLAEWTRMQGDDLLPHRDPYPQSQPLPQLNPGKGRKVKK